MFASGMPRRILAGLVTCVTLCLSQGAAAIDWGYADWGCCSPDFLSYSIQQDMVNRSLAESQRLANQAGQRGGSRTSTEREAAPRLDSRAYAYRHDPAVSAEVSRQYMQKLAAVLQQSGRLEPGDQKKLDELAGVDVPALLRTALQAKGYEANSVATAMAFWMLSHYGVAHQRNTSDLDSGVLMQQLQLGMSSNPKMRDMSDREKQAMAETLLWSGFLQKLAYDEALTQASSQREELASKARASLKESGVDLERLQVVDGSLVLR